MGRSKLMGVTTVVSGICTMESISRPMRSVSNLRRSAPLASASTSESVSRSAMVSRVLTMGASTSTSHELPPISSLQAASIEMPKLKNINCL